MNETRTTLVGNVVSDPVARLSRAGTQYASFRIATTPRRWDAATGAFADGETSFYAVRCWRSLGRGVLLSLRKGQPVVVTGRLRISEWEVDGVRRSGADVDAEAVGHDLSRGAATFLRVDPPRVGEPVPTAPGPGAGAAVPVDADLDDAPGDPDDDAVGEHPTDGFVEQVEEHLAAQAVGGLVER